MADVFSKEKRSEVMSKIKGRNTKLEDIVAKELFSRGFRYRRNDDRYPGKPDLVLPKYKTVIFVHGCFWHRHETCKLAYIPKTRVEFWEKKFNSNKERDERQIKMLEDMGWSVIIIWECELEKNPDTVIEKLVTHLRDQLSQSLC